MVYFTSDLHLGHKAIHKYRNDKFSSQEEHDEYILDKILSLGKRDILVVLGDFIFDSDKYDYYIKRLSAASCRIKVVMGNHDSLKLYTESIFEMQLPLFSYKNMWISHAPIHRDELRGRVGNVHGHLHKDYVTYWDEMDGIVRDSLYLNVNLDVNNYEFLSLDTIKYYFEGGFSI